MLEPETQVANLVASGWDIHFHVTSRGWLWSTPVEQNVFATGNGPDFASAVAQLCASVTSRQPYRRTVRPVKPPISIESLF